MFEREINEPSGCGGDNPDVMSHPDPPLFPIFSTDCLASPMNIEFTWTGVTFAQDYHNDWCGNTLLVLSSKLINHDYLNPF